MSDTSDDHPVTFEEHSDFFSFKVYITIPGVTREVLVPFLRHPDDDSDSFIVTETRLGDKTQALIQYHRDSTPITRHSDIHPKMFFVVDSTDFQERGIMLVHLDAYHGFDDAVRGPIEEKRDELMSLYIGNDDWWTSKSITYGDHPKAVPMQWFSVYNLHSNDETFAEAFKQLNEGLYDVYVDGNDDDAMSTDSAINIADGEPPDDEASENAEEDGQYEEETENDEHTAEEEMVDEDGDEPEPEEPILEDGWDHFYKAVHPGSRDVDTVLESHAILAEENNQDPSFLAIIDNLHEAKGVLLVCLSPGKDSFRCKGPIAGEMLRWIFIGFMTWEEAKILAQSQN